VTGAPAAYLNKAMNRSTLVFRLLNVFTFVYAFRLFNIYSHWAACPVILVGGKKRNFPSGWIVKLDR